MQMSKAQKKETMPCAVDSQPDFPYGLRLRLDNAALEKLGVKNLPKVGAKMMVHGMGVVVSVSAHESKERDDRNVEIQLQEIGIESAEPVSVKERNELMRAEFASRLDDEKRKRKA